MQVIRLARGKHEHGGKGCWMEAISLYAGEKWSDHPECVCPVIAAVARGVNDYMPDDETRSQLIGPHLLAPIGTRSPEHEQARRYIAADWAVRRFAPIALRAARMEKHATKLESLPEIRDEETRAAANAANAAYAAANAAANANAANANAAAAYAAANAAVAYAANANAANAADAAAYAAAYAANANARREVMSLAVDMVLAMIDAGPRAPVECVTPLERIADRLGVLQTA